MKNKEYSDAQILGISEQAESIVPVFESCRHHGMSNASFKNGVIMPCFRYIRTFTHSMI